MAERPILFTGAGLMLGPLGLDVLRIDIAATDLKAIAEAALAMVLFTDAAHADLRVFAAMLACRSGSC